jgi:hypothetical protein
MIAIVLSILLPGLGQFYYGKNIRAILMVLLGLTPLYPLVLIWTIIDIVVLNKKGATPKYSKKDAAWAIVILLVIIPVFVFITASGLFAIGNWYSEKFVIPEQTTSEGFNIVSAIQEFNDSHGKLPSSISELIDSRPLRAGWGKDGWGEPYYFEVLENGTDYKLISKGRDRTIGTDDDIVFR